MALTAQKESSMSITHLANNIYMKLLVISCSLNPQSKSRILGRSAFETLKAQSHSVEWMDLQDYEIPHCDGGDAYGHPHVEILQKKLAEADGVLIACPVYNYSISSTAKNIIDPVVLSGFPFSSKKMGAVPFVSLRKNGCCSGKRSRLPSR